MGQIQQDKMSFLHKLLHDKTANTLAISAAAMFPVLAMVGSGVDASRYFMTASRLQSACDAGALAARQAMTDDTFTTAHRQIGLNFFDQNFEDGIFGTEARIRDFTSAGDGVVAGTASTTLPTSLMGIFGFEDFDLAVTCTAEINISNSDIMFVLDTTGSMADCPDGTKCGSGAGSKIVALREAVTNFYDTVEAATSASAQVRYGFVPYSQQANVGFLLPRQYMADEHKYQSRVARFHLVDVLIPGNGIEEGDWITYSDATEWMPRNTANFGSANEADYRFKNKSGQPTRSDKNDSKLCNSIDGKVYTVNGERWDVRSDTYVLNQWQSGSLNDRAGCSGRIIKQRQATGADVIPDTYEKQVQFLDYRYCQVDTTDGTPCDVVNPAGSPSGWETVNLATLYDDNKIDMPTGTSGAAQTHTWGGCIEEPSTVLTDIYSPIPADAYDLNINLLPANESQKWKPALNTAVWERRDASGNRTTSWRDTTASQSVPVFRCPRAARKLGEITRTDLTTYVNALTASGNTYHDIGMVWGARLISPRGLFAAENSTAPNGDAIARHIVFMTDGAQYNNIENYSTQGIEWWDRRITGSGNSTTEFNRRASRLQAVCRAAQQENVTVWVIAFGTTLTQNLKDCASPGRAFQASDSATLNATFQEIAQKIAALRLTS